MSKRVSVPRPTKGFGYAGAWSDGTAGWFVSEFVHEGDTRSRPSPPNREAREMVGERFFLCEISVRPVTDKRGRPITRIVGRGQ